jgi:hypothetical protein
MTRGLNLYSRILLALLLIAASSCDIVNPPEDIPSFIRVDTFIVEVYDIDQGSASHMMENCYISVGGTNMGVFQMPFTIPTLETGMQTVTIRPGIKLNGIAASRIDYPFFEPYITDIELRENEIHLIEPHTRYKEACRFTWIEDFEDPGLSFVYKDYSDTTFIQQRDVVKEGRYSGAVYVDEENALFEANSATDFELPQNASPVLLEFDYLNNNGFEIGMYLIEDGLIEWYDLVYIRPIDSWNRFYVDLGSTTTRNPLTDHFRIGIRVFHEPENNTNGFVYLDNLKLIHF